MWTSHVLFTAWPISLGLLLLFHNPVHERSDTVPNLYVDLISTPHELLGLSDEPTPAGVPVRMIVLCIGKYSDG
jgi:hypothetical protein